METTTQGLCIHFDLAGDNNHSILLDHSIVTEETVKTIIFELNKIVFGGNLEIQVYVLPVEEGSLIKNFCRIVGSTTALARAFVESTTGSRIIKGLTGKERGDYVESGTIVIKEMVVGFLEKKTTDLTDSGIDYNTFYKAYDAKNKFYQETIKNPKVQGLGFNKEHNFPVPKNEFAYRIVDLKNKTSSIDPIVKYHKLKVISPINTKEYKELSWQVTDIQGGKRFNIYMDDENFYDFFLKDHLFIDTLTVKVSYSLDRDDNGDIRMKKRSITNVFEYNGNVLLPLSESCIIEKAPREFDENNEISELKQEAPKQAGLFDY